jgi:hypothetical protein
MVLQLSKAQLQLYLIWRHNSWQFASEEKFTLLNRAVLRQWAQLEKTEKDFTGI